MKDWIRHTNIYEVNIRQYTPEGTFKAFATHLSRLKDMGTDTLWFMPVTPIAQKNKKGDLGSYYACSDYTSINPEFGTLDDFKALVLQAQNMGMKVIIDWVANHTGWDHWWTQEHPDWYEKDDQTGDFKRASGMDDIIELDFKNPALRRAMIDAMKFWITETSIDGFRCDLAFWVELDFWVEAKNELDTVKQLFWLGELEPAEHPEYMQVFDAGYSWNWMHKTEEFFKGQTTFEELMGLLQSYLHIPGLKAYFTSNHDENSWNGTEYEKYGQLAQPLAVLSYTWPGVPLIYSGQEMPNHKRLQFFEKDMIEWKDQISLHQFYKSLLNLKTSHPALATDAPLEIIKSDDGLLAFKRTNGERKLSCLFNFTNAEKTMTLGENMNTASVLLSDRRIAVNGQNVVLDGWGYLIMAD